MANESTRTKKIRETEIEDDFMGIKKLMKTGALKASELGDKVGFTQEDEYKDDKKPVKKAKGGSVNENTEMKKVGRGMAKADMQKVAGAAVKKHEKAMHGMKSGGYVKAADGCAKRGKTRGMMV
jgi:hypothetical protein